MKKYFLLLLLFFSIFKINAQCNGNNCIKRGLLAALIYEVLFQQDNPDDYTPMVNYPTAFIDNFGNVDLDKKISLVSYLHYGSGITVLSHLSSGGYLLPFGDVERGEAIVALLKAWNIKPDDTGSVSYTDVNSWHPYFGYIKQAENLNLLDGLFGKNLYDQLTITAEELVIIIDRIKNTQYHPVSKSTLSKKSNYFIPNNYRASNLSIVRGIEQAVFSHYAKNSISIPDRKMNLSFSHYYSTQMVELPQSYFPIKPLGRGWTHTYNSYIVREDNVINDTDDLYTIVWPDGSIHIFNQDEDEYITKGVYDEFDENSSTRIYITKKNQVRYRYQKLDSDRKIYYLVEIRDPNGNEINIDYENAEEDDTKRIETVESPSGKKLEFRYQDDTDLIEKIEDPIGREIYFEYSGISGTWVYQYPVLTAFDDAKGNTTLYSYGIGNNFTAHLLKRVRLTEGNIIKAEYDDNNNGKLESYIINGNDEIKIETEFDFNSENPLHSEVIIPMPDGGTQKFEYDYNNNGVLTQYKNDTDDISIKYPSSSSSNTPLLPTETNTNGLKIEYDYDKNGNLEELDIEDGNIIKKYRYDNNNNLTQYTDPEGNITKFSYDSDENLTQIKDALGNTITYIYDTYGQLLSVTNQEGIAIQYTYENDGAVSTITAPEGIKSSFDYDGINRLLSKKVNGLTSKYTYDDNDNVLSFKNTGGFTTSYDYDKNDNIVEIKNTKGISTIFKYNDKDQVISETFGNLEKKYRYNDDGSLDRFTKPSSTRINYDYDDEGRLEEVGTITNIDYNNRNLVEDITNNSGTMRFRYDDVNRLERVTTVDNYKIEYDYEDTGLIEGIEYPTINGVELKVRYNYDKKNRLDYVYLERNVGNNGVLVTEYEYYKDDRIKQIDNWNNTYVKYQYDDAGRLEFLQNRNRTDDTVIYNAFLKLDTRGNILQQQETFQPFSPGYNGGIKFGGVGTSNPSEYVYNNNNHAVTIAGVNHNINNDGNTTSISNDITIKYDIHDRLTKYQDNNKTFNYKYNAYGQRVEQTMDNEVHKFVRDVRTDNVLIDIINGAVQYYYIYTPSGKLVARMTPSGDLSYYHSDVRGSTVAITNDDAEVTHKYRYDDFGSVKRKEEPETAPNRYKYVGTYGVETDDIDLYYMRARYYTPSTGRFLTEDPVWSTNLYPYADNNPISRVDPSGRISDDVIDNKIIPALETIVGIYHVGADIAGLVPWIGEWADGYNALLYSIEGDKTNAALSGAAMIPFAGVGATIGKYGKKLTDLIPSGWVSKVTKNGDGVQYFDPINPRGNHIRIMNGNPNSPNVLQQKPYMKRFENGVFVDKNGNPLPNGDVPEAHIPLSDF